MDKKYFKAPVAIKDEEQGRIEALFSVFNMVDSDGDVVLPTFFTEGQQVPISSWGHKWGDLPVGKGTVHVGKQGAVLAGGFFMDTEHGREHFRTVKNMGNLQDWSFGFDVVESRHGDFDGQEVRFLEKGTLFEVSPVLVGANRETQTLAVKAEEKKAIPYKRTALASEDTPWNGPREVAAAEVSDLQIMCAIVQGDGDKKGDYKLAHHKADGHACVWRGVRAAAAVLMGARGGVDATPAEIAGAKAHIGKHYADFDKGDPPWKALELLAEDDDDDGKDWQRQAGVQIAVASQRR